MIDEQREATAEVGGLLLEIRRKVDEIHALVCDTCYRPRPSFLERRLEKGLRAATYKWNAVRGHVIGLTSRFHGLWNVVSDPAFWGFPRRFDRGSEDVQGSYKNTTYGPRS